MFPRERYARAGVTPDQLDELQRTFEAMPADAQLSEAARISAISDYDLIEEEASQGDAGPEPDTVLGVTEPQTVAEVEAQAEDVPAEVPPATPDPVPGFATGGPVPGPGSVVAGNDGPAAVIPPQ